MKLDNDRLDQMDGGDIRRLRQHLGQTQTQFASTMGVTLITVGRWERGEIQVPGPARRLAQVLLALRPAVEMLHSD
jgi:putative transcriptional regulator